MSYRPRSAHERLGSGGSHRSQPAVGQAFLDGCQTHEHWRVTGPKNRRDGAQRPVAKHSCDLEPNMVWRSAALTNSRQNKKKAVGQRLYSGASGLTLGQPRLGLFAPEEVPENRGGLGAYPTCLAGLTPRVSAM